jgi:hypothetical protein
MKNPHFSAVTDWIERDPCECGIDDGRYCIERAFKVKALISEMENNPSKSHDLFKMWIDPPTPTHHMPNFDNLLQVKGSVSSLYLSDRLATFSQTCTEVYGGFEPYFYTFRAGYIYASSPDSATQLTYYSEIRPVDNTTSSLSLPMFAAVAPFISGASRKEIVVTHAGIRPIVFNVEGINFICLCQNFDGPEHLYGREPTSTRIDFNDSEGQGGWTHSGIDLHSKDIREAIRFGRCASRLNSKTIDLTVQGEVINPVAFKGLDWADNWTEETLSLELQLRSGGL